MWNGSEPSKIHRIPHVFLLLLLLVLPPVAACGSTAAATERPRSTTTASPSGTGTPVRLPLQVAQTPTPESVDVLPARLIIPKMGLDAPILPVGADASGAMVAPYVASSRDPIWSSVYWWDLGALPGQEGNAVIAGHVNRPDGSPSTFTRLDRLVPGDRIEVVTAGGRSLSFVVTSKETPLIREHDPGDPAFIRVFGPSLTPNLNLVTCWGEWIGNTYNRRLVIHGTLIGPSPSGNG
jgi:sortase (surface protein transpeptidase)